MSEFEEPTLPDAIYEQLRRVSTATISMILLKRGIRRSWLDGPKPLAACDRIAGPAFTIRFVPGREDLSGPESYARPGSFRDAIEAAPAGSIVVIDGRQARDTATLGDILVARLAARGVAGAVTDAPVRDAAEIRRVGLPVFSAGAAAPPSITGLAYVGYAEIIGCGGVAVCPGDVVVADGDGPVVIPRSLAAEVAEAGLEQERYERYVQIRVKAGASVVGIYPPAEPALEDYRRWLDAGEPAKWGAAG